MSLRKLIRELESEGYADIQGSKEFYEGVLDDISNKIEEYVERLGINSNLKFREASKRLLLSNILCKRNISDKYWKVYDEYFDKYVEIRNKIGQDEDFSKDIFTGGIGGVLGALVGIVSIYYHGVENITQASGSIFAAGFAGFVAIIGGRYMIFGSSSERRAKKLKKQYTEKLMRMWYGKSQQM